MKEYVPSRVHPVEAPRQFAAPQLTTSLEEVDRLVQAAAARQQFQVDGKDLTVAVLDTGLNTQHVDFTGRIQAQRNFTSDNNGPNDDVRDGYGHGTNVTGIVAARKGQHTGTAPGAMIASVKVLNNRGGGSFGDVAAGLRWVEEHRVAHNITAVCMSLGDGRNHASDKPLFDTHEVTRLVETLRGHRVPVCIAAGNEFFLHESAQGMAFPGILRAGISVGAVYDEFEGPFSYKNGAWTRASGPDRITPFSQRLHRSVGADCCTDIFAPGAPVRSAGINGPRGESIQHGTSQAAPVATGVVLLMQEFHLREAGQLPTVEQLVDWLHRGGVSIQDGDDEVDNVENTDLEFTRLSAVGSLVAVRRDLEKRLLESETALKGGGMQ